MANGRIIQIIGPVVDVEFPAGSLPAINTALLVTNAAINDKPWNLTVEVALHTGESSCRCVAMDTTDGLRRDQEVRDTGEPIKVPVGNGVLGRILNGTGKPIDGGAPVIPEKRFDITGSPINPYRRDQPADPPGL